MKRLLVRSLIFLLLASLFLTLPAHAQEGEETLTLSLKRDFGYGGGVQIQGLFTMSVQGPDNLVLVDFFIDDVVVNSDREPPFCYQFHTDDYSLGMHAFSATGTTSDGKVLHTAERNKEFVPASTGWKAAANIALWTVGISVLVGGLAFAFPILLSKKQPSFQIGDYGPLGGAVCPRCHLPFKRHLLSPSLVTSKLERCPHCGKLAIVAKATDAELQAAEGRYEAEGQLGKFENEDEEERLRRMVDDSRFEE